MFFIYLEESPNKAASQAPADGKAMGSHTSAEIGQIARQEIGAKWDKLSEQDLSALKDRDDLVREVVSRYGIEKSQAQHDVDFVLQGRQI
jgi:hypothetical protein